MSAFSDWERGYKWTAHHARAAPEIHNAPKVERQPASSRPCKTRLSRIPAESRFIIEVTTEDQIRALTVGELSPLSGRIEIVDYDPQWPALFQREAERIRGALGERVLVLEHTGSTSVPGLAAKPIIDMLLAVAHSSDEPAYVPALGSSGYRLSIREPDWYEHRMFKGSDTDVNLHVFSQGCPEIERILRFRDWLRNNTADRDLYARTKLALAEKDWTYVQNYADAKTVVIEDILRRAGAGPTVS